MRTVWTVGHSTHSPEHFISLLQGSDVEFLIDVRSAPRSRIAPQFDKDLLKEVLRASHIRYAFFGMELGGRPPERELYDDYGRVLYWAVARLQRFRAAIERLVRGSDEHRIAVMCAEENPGGCHRRLLVGRVLTEYGVLLRHLRADGRVEEEQAVELLSSGPLIGAIPDEERDWKSIRSVSQKKTRGSSSNESSLRARAP